MAHVEISVQENGGASIVVDGHDLSSTILSRGFAVHLNEVEGVRTWEVHCVIRAHTLDINLPDAVLQALRSDGDGGIEA